MCSGSKTKQCSVDLDMEKKNGIWCKGCSKLLEFSAKDDVAGFIYEVEEKGCDVNEMSLWYGRKIGSKKMGLEERTPLAIASMYGSTKVLKYILGTGHADVNMACGSDGATPLHCGVAGGTESSLEVVELLIGKILGSDLTPHSDNTQLAIRGFQREKSRLFSSGFSQFKRETELMSQKNSRFLFS